MSTVIRCTNVECGEEIRVDDDFAGSRIRCPVCDTVCRDPREKAHTAIVLDHVPDEDVASDDDLAGERKRSDAERRWYAGMHPGWRCGFASALVALSILTAVLFRQPLAGLFCFGMSFLFVVLVIGTYERLTLTYSKKGRPVLIRQRFVLFIPGATLSIPLIKYPIVRIDSAWGRNRQVGWSAPSEVWLNQWYLVLLTGVLPYSTYLFVLCLLESDSGGGVGRWQIILQGEDEVVAFEDMRLSKVKAIVKLLKKVGGLREVSELARPEVR
jgi:hypothetical protein